MENPFESGHIKNYLLLYASVVVIMILFFVASSLYNDVEQLPKKEFNTTTKSQKNKNSTKDKSSDFHLKYKLMPQQYN
jgi:hypothetical protein